jgi:succinate dehydrogenase / fumarate reductase cytochrome b subunit
LGASNSKFAKINGCFIMNWIIRTFTSTLGRKFVMSLTGLFLCSFLVIHLVGNFQLFKSDNGLAFNDYSHFMTHNPIIAILEWGLLIGFLIHILQSVVLTIQNRKARPVKYIANKPAKNSTWYSRNMGIMGAIILVFLVIHLRNFFFETRFTDYKHVDSAGMKDYYYEVVEVFKNGWYVALYVVSMAILAFHLLHGFQSAFQSLGLKHPKYSPLINAVGLIFSIVVPLGFMAMPLYFYFIKQ